MRNKGSYQLQEVYSANTHTIYLDAVGLVDVPALYRDFELYEKFFIHDAWLEFVPNQPVTVGGTIAMAPDYDPIDPVPSSMAELSSSAGYVTQPITSKCICKMPNFKLPDGNYVRPALYTGPSNNDRLVSYGKIIVMATSSLTDDTDLGRLVLHWDISFSIKQPLYNSIASFPGSVWAVKSTCDNSGAVPVPDMTATVEEDEALLLNSAHTTAQNFDADKIYAGIVQEISNMTVSTKGGKTVTPGTRVFWRAPNIHLTSATASVKPYRSAANHIGAMAVSRTFDALTNLTFDRVVDGFMDMANLVQLS